MYTLHILGVLIVGVQALLSNISIAADLPDNTQPSGENPIKRFKSELLGYMVADNSCSHRDLGFTGSISGRWYAVYGDALWCKQGITDPIKDDTKEFHGMVRDAVSAVTRDPLKVHDLHLNNDKPVPHQLQFVPFNTSWGEEQSYGFGGTSLVEVDGTRGIGALYYLVNANEKGLKGAGIARVDLINNVPTVTHRFSIGNTGYWWPSEDNVRHGDVAAYRDVNSEYIYILGGVPNSIKNDRVQQSYVYQARVMAKDAFNLSRYEYWWGRKDGWKMGQPLKRWDKETAVMWGTGQGQLVFLRFFNCYIFVHVGGNKVQLRTSQTPYGPWSADVSVYDIQTSKDGMAYAGVVHPYFDESGRTLIVSYTNMPNEIQVVKVTFLR